MINSYQPTLRINDSEVKLSKFSFSAPAGNIGSKCDVTIADVAAEILRGDQFDLTLRITGGSQPKSRLIKNGKVIASGKSIASQRAQGLTLRADSFQITGVDAIGGKWTYTRRTPMILYDPAFVILQDTELNTNVNDEDGNRIFAESRALTGLDLQQILQFAYIEVLGFTDLITNLPNYPIPRADFSLSSAYHSIASSFYSLFEPLVFEDDDRLFILDVYGEIPPGVLSGARDVGVDKYLSFDTRDPEIAVVNAVMLSHKEVSVQSLTEDEFPENVTQRTDVETQDIGTFGQEGWIRNQFTRFVAEIHDDEDNPDRITSEIVWRVETRTTGLDEDGFPRELMIETQTDLYSNSWRLKLGYTKTTQVYAEDGSGGKLLQQAQTETNRLVWQPSITNPGEYEKLYSQTQISGLVVVEGEGEDVTKTPLIEATRNKTVPDDGSASIEEMSISSVNETWRYTGADQIEVHTQKIDHLVNRVELTKTTEHIGTNAARVRTGSTFNTKQVLLTDPDSDLADGAREPISFDAGYVQYPIAKELALRKLESVRTPRTTVTARLATFDAGIRRGSIRNLIDRDGNVDKVIVTGYSVEGLPVVQTIEGVVI